MSTATLTRPETTAGRSTAVRDSLTMLRRNLKHMQRYPAMTVSILVMPLIFLLLFVYVFGGAIGTGTLGPGTDRGDYINYMVPGIIVMTATAGAVATAVSVCTDKTEGIINRFRTMSISRGAMLSGHVLGSTIQVTAVLTLITGVSLAIGFRPDASFVEWVAAAGLLIFLALGLSWLCAGMGMNAKTPESASNGPLPLTLLPLMGSSLVDPASMPVGLKWFAENQPFTPITETVRGLLMGSEIGNNGWIALLWCAALVLFGYWWALRAYNKTVTR
ncbi:ABC transporter permease [Streptomyces sp. NPDC050418]|uniref:ABC transporter permease n=1 Tax=Streptomyces sp. NPDC050418 TaxID=3365612 RepID=UPI0037B1B2EE